MMAGNYMGDFVGFSDILENTTVQLKKPAVQTWIRLRRIFYPEQYSRDNLLEKASVGQ